VIFKIRTQLLEVFCSQVFVDRVESAGLQGFAFIPIWPLPEGRTFYDEMNRVNKAKKQWKPRNTSELNITGNTVVLRLYCEGNKASEAEMAAVENIKAIIETQLYDPNQNSAESYFGNFEGYEAVDNEIRIFISTPDCDRLIQHLMPTLRELHWPGKFHVVKRRNEYFDEDAVDEYVRLT
jgi:hypothetical protein